MIVPALAAARVPAPGLRLRFGPGGSSAQLFESLLEGDTIGNFQEGLVPVAVASSPPGPGFTGMVNTEMEGVTMVNLWQF